MIRLLKTPNNKRKFLVFLGDVIIMAAVISFLVFLHAFLVRHGVLRDISRPLKSYTLYISLIVYILFSYIFEVYEIKRREKLRTFVSMLVVSVLAFCFMFSMAKVLQINQTSMVYIFMLFNIAVFLLYFWRSMCRKLLLTSQRFIKQKVLFVGADPITQEILDEIKHRDYKIVGLLSDDDSNSNENPKGLKVIGLYKQLRRIIRERKVNVIVIAMNVNLSLGVSKELYKERFSGIEIYDSAYFYEMVARKVAIKHYLEGDSIPYLNIDIFVKQFSKNIKRFGDLCGALFILIIALPLFITVMILVKLTSKGPVFFTQKRLGFQEKTFKLIKFRTMVVDAEKKKGPQWAERDDMRVTKFGKFLRKTRLDELPQLLNICKGDISFVGPRPIRGHFADIIEKQMPFYSLRFVIKPGLTGWSQVNYDYGGTVEGHIEKFQYDLYYLKHASIFLDIFIILKTIQTIVQRPAY